VVAYDLTTDTINIVPIYTSTFNIPNVMMPYGQRYVPWYQEMSESTFSAGGQPKYLQWTAYVRDSLTSRTLNWLNVTIPQLHNYLPTDAANYANLQCFWLPIKSEESQLGFPLWTASPCTLTTNVQPYFYQAVPSWETLPAGHYVLRVTYESNATSAVQTFDVSDASQGAPAQYSELTFQLVTPLAVYNDILRINTVKPFVSSYVTHNSLTTNSYDYFFVNFKVPTSVTAGSTGVSETIIAVDIKSQPYYSTPLVMQDLFVNSDANMYINEAAGSFTNGGRFPFKLYKNGVDVAATPQTAVLALHYGQWNYGETPISLRLSLIGSSSTLATSDTYQLRISMVKAPASTSYPTNVEVYVQQIVQGVSPFPQNVSEYKFVNYAQYSSTAPSWTPSLANVNEDAANINRAQQASFKFYFQLSNLN
jgi:hypothetical protein